MVWKQNVGFVLSVVVVLCCCGAGAADADKSANPEDTLRPLVLWYDEPATKWEEALPIGNGRLGAMVYGNVKDERIPLNEDRVWEGEPYKPVAQSDGPKVLPKIRKLIFVGKYLEAQKLFGPAMKIRDEWGFSSYQFVGDMLLSFAGHEKIENYRRELDLDTAIVRVSYKSDGVTYVRELFASPVDQTIVIRLTADKPGRLSFTAKIKGAHKTNATGEGGVLVLRGSTGGPLKYEARLKTIAQGGTATIAEDAVVVKDADAATILLVAATNLVNYKDLSGDPQERTKKYLAAINNKSYEELRKDHIAEHQRLFRRVELKLEATEVSKLPTDERLKKFDGNNDPDLTALYFQFGRYLLMSSSRPGSEPVNCQGIWNDKLQPAWDSRYCTNINVEMAYWPAEVCNLGECLEPLVGMIKDWYVTGTHTAKLHYGARGWVHHFNSDLWRMTAPFGGGYFGTWATAGPWCCQHLWEHYLFTGDKDFLREVYPIMKGSAMFFVDTLQEHPNGDWLVTCPSNSPENWYKIGDNPKGWDPKMFEKGLISTICAAPTIDMQLLRHLFANCIEASKILGVDEQFSKQLAQMRKRLVPNQIGQYGQLQEWMDDWDYPTDQHRHFSHVWGMYPGNEISVRKTPELAKAVKKSLQMRGEGGVGFGMAWQTCIWARMYEAETAQRLFNNLIHQNTFSNLFNHCYKVLVVDGNLGATAAIAEMLMQSHEGEINLLPAIPKALSKGSVKGLLARGGFEVDIQWANGSLTSTSIKSKLGNDCRIRYGEKVISFETKKDKTYRFDGRLNKI